MNDLEIMLMFREGLIARDCEAPDPAYWQTTEGKKARADAEAKRAAFENDEVRIVSLTEPGTIKWIEVDRAGRRLPDSRPRSGTTRRSRCAPGPRCEPSDRRRRRTGPAADCSSGRGVMAVIKASSPEVMTGTEFRSRYDDSAEPEDVVVVQDGLPVRYSFVQAQYLIRKIGRAIKQIELTVGPWSATINEAQHTISLVHGESTIVFPVDERLQLEEILKRVHRAVS